MWDTVITGGPCLSHDRPCASCGHAAHTYLPCSDACTCSPPAVPGAVLETRELVSQA